MNRTANDVTIVCYDITSDKLRQKIDNAMKDFGVRLQFSVFLCRLNADGVSRCREKLLKTLTKFAEEKEPDDSVIIFERISSGRVDCLLGDGWAVEQPVFEIF